MPDYLGVTHVALSIADVRAAESYYCALFELEVAWRDSGGAASMFATWDDLDAAGASPEVIMVYREELRIALANEGRGDGGPGLVDHLGLQVSADQLRRIRARAAEFDLDINAERGDEVLGFLDRYGVQWELDTRSFADPIAIARCRLSTSEYGSCCNSASLPRTPAISPVTNIPIGA